MTNSVHRVGEHLAVTLRGLDGVRGDVRAARRFLALLGWDLPVGGDLGLSLLDVSGLAAVLDNVVELRSDETSSDLDIAEAVGELVGALGDAFDSIEALVANFQASSDYLDATHIVDEFFPRLSDLLIIQMVGLAAPVAVPVGVLLGVFELTLHPADPTIFQVEHVRQVVRWDRLASLITDPDEVLHDVYGWGTADFAGNHLVINMSRVLEHVAADLTARPLPRAVEELLTGQPAPAADDEPAVQVLASLAKGLGFDAHDVGVSFYALRPTAPGAIDGGLGISPYAIGTDEVSFPIGDTLTLDLTASADIEGGFAIVLRAGNDPELVGGLLSTPTTAPDSATFGIVLRSVPAADATADKRRVLFSAPGLVLDAAAVSAGLTVAADLEPTVRVVIDDGHLRLAPDRSDGFLASILPAGGFDIPVDLGISWSRSAGLRFVGAAGLRTSVALDVNVGPLALQRVDLAITAGNDGLRGAATLAYTVGFGPITVIIDGLGAAIALRFERGNLGPVDLGVDFLPPLGLGLVVGAGIVTGGGFIRFEPTTGRYTGVLELTAGDLSITGVGVLDTRLPGGTPGYALLISLRATFPGIQIGFGFSITAVGGLVALNRRIDVDALRGRLASGTAGRILAPADPVRDASALLADLDAVFPIAPGVTVIGPTARLVWAELVTFDIGIFIELPGPSRIVLLGSARAAIEARGRTYLIIRVDVVGAVDLQKSTAAFDAVLVDSQLLEILDLTGDAAFRMSWGDQPYAVLAVGGFHPAFNPEPLPVPATLRRIAMVHGHPDDRVYLRLEGYFAVTSNTLQFGAAAEMVLNAGNFSIRGTLDFDAIIRFEPFHFQFDIRASVRVRYKSRNVAGLTLTGSLEGPGPVVLRAKVCIELLFFDICFSETFRLGSSTPPPLATIASAFEVIDVELDRRDNLQADSTGDPSVALRHLPDGTGVPVVSPVGQLVWSQRRAPLGPLLQRIGGVPLIAAHSVDATSADAADAEVEWFAPGSFADLTDDQALTRPGFEQFAGGLRIGGGTQDGPGRDRTLTIRQIRIPSSAEVVRDVFGFPSWILVANARAAGRTEPVAKPVGAVSVTDERWTVADVVDGTVSSVVGATRAHQLADLATESSRLVAVPTRDLVDGLVF